MLVSVGYLEEYSAFLIIQRLYSNDYNEHEEVLKTTRDV